LLASFLAVMAAAAVSVAVLDRPLARYYRYDADVTTVAAFRAFSWVGKAEYYLVTLAALAVGLRVGRAFSLYERTRRILDRAMDACIFMALSICVSGLVLHVIKAGLGRFRPRALLDSGLYELAPFTLGYQNSSFPSGHSQLIWSVATALILIYPRYDLAYVVVAVLVSYGRVITGDHYLSDVIFGSYLGIVTALVLKHRLYDRRHVAIRLGVASDRRLAVRSRRALRHPHRKCGAEG
jgi:membrane-associated phospholipid phosphatase